MTMALGKKPTFESNRNKSIFMRGMSSEFHSYHIEGIKYGSVCFPNFFLVHGSLRLLRTKATYYLFYCCFVPQKSSCLSRAGSLPQQVSGMVRSISFSSQWEPLIWEKSPLYIPSEFCLSSESSPGERRNETWRQPQSAFGRRVLKMCSQWNTIPYSNHPQSHSRYE